MIRTQAYGIGIGNIYFDEVDCRGNENNITECRHAGEGMHNCGHLEDAAVLCRRKQNKSSTPVHCACTTITVIIFFTEQRILLQRCARMDRSDFKEGGQQTELMDVWRYASTIDGAPSVMTVSEHKRQLSCADSKGFLQKVCMYNYHRLSYAPAVES